VRFSWLFLLAAANFDFVLLLLVVFFKRPLLAKLLILRFFCCMVEFFVSRSSNTVGHFIYKLRSFECQAFKLFFYLWNNGGPN